MRAKLVKRISLALVAALALLLFAGAVVGGSGIAVAANEPIESVAFVQMSDIHYFPIESCFQDVNSPNYKTSDFYHSTTGDTKLVLESGVILNNAVHKIIQKVIEDAKDGKAPMYFIATGDLSKNGERAALIDVANALRFMQNEIRSKAPGYENFQVLAQIGNHDLYNSDAALYNKENGDELVADAVTAAQFALIFAGLGFPNANLDGSDGAVKLTDYMPEEYWASEYVSNYQYSKNADNLKITYFSQALAGVADASNKIEKYFEIGDGINQLSYSVEIEGSDFGFLMLDSGDREATDNGKPVRLSQGEYEYLKSKGEPQKYFAEKADGGIDFEHALTDDKAAEDLFAQGKAVYRAAKYSHITGGRLTEGLLNWAENFANEQHQKASRGDEKTLVAAFHHNLLPHFEVEDDILKDFTLYNWEYAAKRFLDMGVRYVFTGHQHASDIAAYTDAEGRTIYDSETGSMVSYESPRRYIYLDRYLNADGKLAEKYSSAIFATEDMKEIASSFIDQDNVWDEEAYQTALEAYNASKTPENWDAVIASNPHFVAYIVAYDRLSTRNYNQYIGEEIYTQLVDRVLNHFLTQDTVDGLLDTVDNMIANLDLGIVVNAIIQSQTGFTLGKDGSLRRFVNYLLDFVTEGLYPDNDGDGIGDYPYNGKTYDGILNYLVAVINDVVDMEFGDPSLQSSNQYAQNNKGKLNLKEMAGFIMMAHTTGTEVKLVESDEALQAEYDAIDDEFDDLGSQYGDFAFKNPIDRTYRKRMTAALKDAHEQLVSGKFAGDLLDALLDPLYRNDDALLRRLLTVPMNIYDAVEKGYLEEFECDKITENIAENLSELLTTFAEEFGQDGLENIQLEPIYMNNFTLAGVINNLLPVIKPLVANLIGFNLSGNNIFEIIDGALDGYVTESFLIGLGGIADEIVTTYATDNFPDIANMKDASQLFTVQPYAGYDAEYTYDSSKVVPSSVGASFNAATQDNGRVPSRLTANFDNVNSTSGYTFKFYTDEGIYARFKYKAATDTDWTTVETALSLAHKDEDYFDSPATATKDGVTVKMLTQTRPAYVPLIDLGLACITHGEIANEDADGNEIPITFREGQRDSSANNSVIYKNVTTVELSGLKAGETYEYDIEGVYVTSEGKSIYFSLAQAAGEEYYTFTTAPDENTDSFEFLTIADIQGMIQGMYSQSHKAVEALLKDERTKDFAFLLNAGDMVDNGKNFRQWGMALNTYQDLFANTSQFFTAGNHEDGKNAFATYFNYTLPVDAEGNRLQEDITDGAFYSFDYGNSHFTVLNTNDADSSGLGEVQLEWLKADLQKAQSKKWRFVLMHKSLFSGGSHSYDGEVIAMRAQLVPLFAQYNVSVVFAGHDHTYTTTTLVNKNGKAINKPDLDGVRYTGDGVMYVTLGTLGTKFYTYGENKAVTPKFNKDSSILRTLTSQTFGKVKVTNDAIEFTGYVYDPATNSLSVIGKPVTLSANKVFPASAVYGIIGGGVGAIVLAAAIVTIVLVKKKKKTAAVASESEQQSE